MERRFFYVWAGFPAGQTPRPPRPPVVRHLAVHRCLGAHLVPFGLSTKRNGLTLRFPAAPTLAFQGFPSRPKGRSAALQGNCRHCGNPRLLEWSCYAALAEIEFLSLWWTAGIENRTRGASIRICPALRNAGAPLVFRLSRAEQLTPPPVASLWETCTCHIDVREKRREHGRQDERAARRRCSRGCNGC